MKPKMELWYFSYPYSDNPLKRTEEIKDITRNVMELRPDIVPIVPHTTFGALYDWERGYNNPNVCVMEIETISRCDGLAYDIRNLSAGVWWEIAIATWMGKKISTYEGLLSTDVRIKKFRVGMKFDEGKPRVDLLVPEFILDTARIMTVGMKKYGVDNWKGDLDKGRILSALYRHVLAYHTGELNDGETGFSHLCHVMANAMFLYWYEEVKEDG